MSGSRPNSPVPEADQNQADNTASKDIDLEYLLKALKFQEVRPNKSAEDFSIISSPDLKRRNLFRCSEGKIDHVHLFSSKGPKVYTLPSDNVNDIEPVASSSSYKKR
jgi:hypothetical protein